MKNFVNCTLRPVIDTKFSQLVFIPVIYNLLKRQNKRKWLIILVVLMWLWPFAFLCSDSGNLFIRAAEGVMRDVIFTFAAVYLVDRFTNFNPIITMAASAVVAYFAQYFLGQFVTFLAPLGSATTFLNPLMYLNLGFTYLTQD